MKTFFTKIAITLFLLFSVIVVNAADRYAVANGNWNATATWSATNGGAPGASVPGAGDNVFISTGRIVTLTNSPSCDNITVLGTLNVTGGNLTVSDGGFLIVNSGGSIIFSATNTINGGSNGSGGVAVTISSGANLTTANASGFQTGTGNNNIYGGSINVNNGNKTNASYSSTANYTFNLNTGAAQSTGNGITGASNLTFAGSGAKTLSVGTTVTGVLSMQGGATLTNAPSYGGSATLEYAGSAAQTTGVEFPASGLTNLRINNASGVTLNAAKSISGQLTLTSGTLNTATNLLTLNAGASASFTAGSATSFVDGPLAKAGTTAFTFPVGKAGSGMREISIAAPSTSSTFVAEFNRAAAPNRGLVASGITQVSACEHWTLNRTAGTGNAAVTLTWSSSSPCNGALYVTNTSDLRVARFNGTVWVSEGNTGTTGDNTNGTITSATVSSFSPFALGSANSGTNPLPVKFNDVKAFEKGNNIQVEWTNLTESDVYSYEVERSVNGIDFTTISTVIAKGNLGSKESYMILDQNPAAGVNFYRIKANGVTGKSFYSQLLQVKTGTKATSINLYPNPVQGNMMTANFTADKGKYVLRIVNGIGQEIYTQVISHQGGNLSQTITLPATIKKGLYTLLIAGDYYKENKTFIIQ